MLDKTPRFLTASLKTALMLACLLLAIPVMMPSLSFAQTLSAEEECDPGNDKGLQSAMNQASVAYQTAAMTAAEQAYRKMTVTDLSACIMKLQTYWSIIKGLLMATIDGLAALIVALLEGLITQICNYIVTAINNLLASICIPVPNLSFSFSLPSLASESCDGFSLLNFMSINGAGSPFPAGMPRMNINGMSLGAETLMRKR